MEHFSLLFVSCEVFTSLCLCTTAAFVGWASSKKTDKVKGIFAAVYSEDVCSKIKEGFDLLACLLDLLALSRLQLQATYHFLYTKIPSTSENAFNESLEADDVFSQLT